MAIAKVILNGEVQMDVTSDTVEANKLLSGETATKNDGTKVTGTFVAPDPVISSLSVTPTESAQTFNEASISGYKPVTVAAIASDYVGSAVPIRSSEDVYFITSQARIPSGYYSTLTSAAMPYAEISKVSPYDTFDSSTGRLSFGFAVTSSGYAKTKTDTGIFAFTTLSAQTITPTESTQYISSYRWLTGSQTIAAIASDYIGSAVNRLELPTSLANTGGGDLIAELIPSGVKRMFTISSGYYSQGGYYQLPIGVDYPTSISTVSSGALISTFTPSTDSLYLNMSSSGYFTGNSYYRINAIPSEYVIPAGTLSITSNGTYDVGAYASASVSVGGVDEIYSSIYWQKNLTNEQIISHLALSASIPAYAFAGRNTLNNYIFSTLSGLENVTSIGSYAFYNCANLNTAEFPSATIINTSAFYSCSSLRTISFPLVKTINPDAFHSCVALTTADFPSATSIGARAFKNDTIINTINFPLAISIGAEAFYSCRSITTAIFPLVKTIDNYAFCSCFSLTSISFPSATSIGQYTFYNCQKLTTADFPSVTSIGSGAFSSCTSLTTANFPLTKFIGSGAFCNCSKLTTADFPSATTISISAFYKCSSLTSISFPSVTIIGADAFYNCQKLTTADFPSVTSIGQSAFYSCFSLTSISFPLATNISASAFYSCPNLMIVSFPSATYIGASAFYSCVNLSTISFPLVTSVGYTVFGNCGAIKTANFPLLTTTQGAMFYNCSTLSEVSMPLLSRIEANMFYNCKSLRAACFPSATSISTYAFYNDLYLSKISFPLATSISNYAFAVESKYNPANGVPFTCYLSKTVFPAAEIIGDYIFNRRTGLTTINLPSVISIGSRAFYELNDLVSMHLFGTTIPSLKSTAAFVGTPIESSKYTGVYGSIFVRASMADAFKTATNWSYYSARIVGLTDEEIAPIMHCGDLVFSGTALSTVYSSNIYSVRFSFQNPLSTGSDYVLNHAFKFMDTDGMYHLIGNSPGAKFTASSNEIQFNDDTHTWTIGAAYDHMTFLWNVPSSIIDSYTISYVILDYDICEYDS